MSTDVMESPTLLDFIDDQIADEATDRALLDDVATSTLSTREAVEAANDAKLAGQDASMADLTTVEVQAFMRSLARFPIGSEISANDTLADLDAAHVPAKARAGLWRTACTLGILRPRMEDYRGEPIHFKIPSTNPTNRRAYVGTYYVIGRPPEVS